MLLFSREWIAYVPALEDENIKNEMKGSSRHSLHDILIDS